MTLCPRETQRHSEALKGSSGNCRKLNEVTSSYQQRSVVLENHCPLAVTCLAPEEVKVLSHFLASR